MGNVPERRAAARPYRAVLTYLEKRIFLPDISPSYYHAFALGATVLVLYVEATGLRVLILALMLVADWADGATARRYNRSSRAGYMMDVIIDRVCEGLIFAAAAGTTLGKIFYGLWLINLGLAYYSIRTSRHTSLPLRFAYLLMLLISG